VLRLTYDKIKYYMVILEFAMILIMPKLSSFDDYSYLKNEFSVSNLS